ncbi:uncharacterized protein PPP1R15 [Epargyreus clarus]|uniref:uncharacterized protein PPP1R15 n=1 Tax=Epargyreus clarus TaxID=520877 RepID=UPI003C2AB86E
MNNFSVLDSRNRRNLLAHGMNAFSPPFHKNYSTDTTADMKTSYGDSLFINTMHLIPEPLKMDLADSVVGLEETKSASMTAETKGFVNKPQKSERSDYYPSLGGIASFFSGVLNVMGAMFQRRSHSPVQYYDCFEQGFDDHHQMPPSARAWHAAKHEDQNKNGRAEADEFADETYAEFSSDMNEDFRSIAAHCEDKLNRVRLLLSSNSAVQRTRPRRPKRAFHEPGSIEESYEDAFTPEDFITLANETFLEYCSPYNHHNGDLHEIDGPKIKTETTPLVETIDIVQNVPPKDSSESKSIPENKVECVDTKREVVVSCEDKVSQLKALLQCRRQQKGNDKKLDLSTNISTCKAACIPSLNSGTETPKPEVIFSKEIEIPTTPDSASVLDPSSYFDEVTGRFYSSSATDSEDSFQIVFSDSPRNNRRRIPSDCESEDSFIVFEETPDSCYTSNDVFGDETNNTTNLTDSEDSDSDCDDFDSGVSTITLSNSLSKTFGDLTDGSLYDDSEDVVDCAFRSGAEIPRELIYSEKAVEAQSQDHKRGLLLDEAKKRERQKLPAKKVHFSEKPPKVHVMRVWAFAARQARAGHWERHALDRERFKRRIADVDMAVSWVLKPQHRSRVMFQRFMPWWNAQKRQELAEKKQKEEDERLKREKEDAERVERERLGVNDELGVSEANNTQINDEDLRKAEVSWKTDECVSSLDTVGNVNKVSDNNVDSDRLKLDKQVEVIIENNKEKVLEKTTDKVEKSPGKMCNGVVHPNCNDNANKNGLIMDNQMILKNKLIDSPVNIKTDCDKTKFIEGDTVDLNGEVKLENRIVLKNGMDKAGLKMLCYKHEQTL